MYRGLVIEDHDLMRLALIAEIKASLSECIMLGAPTLRVALELMSGEDFDLVVIDPGLPGVDPTSSESRQAVVEQIIDASPGAIHLVVTGSDSISEAETYKRIGVAGYLGKTGLGRDVLATILQDISNTGFSIRLSNISASASDFHYSRLTQREQEVIDLMRRRERGMKRRDIYKQMAEQLGINAETIEKYYKQARAKLLKQGSLPKGF